LLARVVIDATYLRAVLGSSSLLLPVAGLAVGVVAGVGTGGRLTAPTLALMVAIPVLGVLDAAAGLLAVLAFDLIRIGAGSVTTADDWRLLLGLGVSWFAAALIAGAARPLRRAPGYELSDHWDRMADIVVASLVGAWAVQKMVKGLPGLSNRELPIAHSASTIGWCVLAALVVRLVLETVAVHLYPQRLLEVAPEVVPKPSSLQRTLATLGRTALFVFVAVAFVGLRWQTWVGAALFLAPQLLSIVEDRIPSSTKLYLALPRGVVKTVIMLVVGTVTARVVLAHLHGPEVIANAFVLLSLPGFALSLLDLIGRDGPSRQQRWLDRLGGTGVLALGILLAQGILRI
jgi:cytochrome b561